MSAVEQSVEVGVPVRTAYNQWTQFEEFPRFMQGVEEVRQITDTRNHWKTVIGGIEREFDTEISEQRPDERIAWHAVEGPSQAGVVTFHRLGDRRSRVMLQMEFDPEGVVESAGDKLGFVERRIKGDLTRFKEFVEKRGAETGAWRGEVDQDPTR
jgi:uncharacterized membrane protein